MGGVLPGGDRAESGEAAEGVCRAVEEGGLRATKSFSFGSKRFLRSFFSKKRPLAFDFDKKAVLEVAMDKATQPEFIESTAGQVAEELARRGISPDQRVLIAIEPDDWIAEARKFPRPLVEAAGWTDDDIDRIIDEEREAVQKRP
jgi:hypothetical protein